MATIADESGLAPRAAIEGRLADWLGAFEITADHSWPHGESLVLEVMSAAGRGVAKAHRQLVHYERETGAYRDGVPAIADRAPRLLFADAALRLILTSWIDGQSADAPPHRTNPDIYRQAGALLRRFHDGTPTIYDDDAGPLLLNAFDRWATAAREGLIDPADVAGARAIAARAHDLGTVPMTLCHQDYSPRNWLVDSDGAVHIIDFATASKDHCSVDWLRMADNHWDDRPALRDAFFDGYGKMPDAADRAYARAYTARWAVTTIIWADQHADPAFEMFGRKVLARVLAEG